jgi:hypothetical protein
MEIAEIESPDGTNITLKLATEFRDCVKSRLVVLHRRCWPISAQDRVPVRAARHEVVALSFGNPGTTNVLLM